MDISNDYLIPRKECGKQPRFCEFGPVLLDSIVSNKAEQKNYILRNPVHKDVQVSSSFSEHHINTKRVVVKESGVNHLEGGWPKDVNFLDEEAASRHRRRIERDEGYVNAVLNTYDTFKHYVDQNNAVELYEMYFNNMQPQNSIEKLDIKVKNCYKDPSKRPIACITWTREDDSKLVIASCDQRFPVPGLREYSEELQFYVWCLENPYDPYLTLRPPSRCWQVATLPSNPFSLLAGLADGRVCVFDFRADETPTSFSPVHLSHRDPVSALLAIQSRHNTEFFSGSTDGQCLWWDVRNLSKPFESLCISVNIPPGQKPNLGNSEPVRALQFDRALPTKFLCGTDTGLVINVNRKGKTLNETMCAVFHAHHGPVKAVHRSPLTTKMFITCGDFNVHLWSDDVLTSPIVTGTSQKYQISDVVFAPHKYSCYMCVDQRGKLYYWDLMCKIREPIYSVSLSKDPLLKIQPNETGKLVAIGDNAGVIVLVELSDNLVLPTEKEKSLMMQNYERETKRERLLEARVKEIRLKLRTEEEAVPEVPVDVADEEALVAEADQEYRKAVALEAARMNDNVMETRKTERKR